MSLTPAEKLQRARASLESLREKAERGLQQALGAVESGAVAGALGVYEGYHGESLKIFGADGALVAGIAGHGLALMSPRYGQHFAAMADGAIAVWAYRTGKEKGEEWKKEKDSTGDVRAFQSPRRALLAAADTINTLADYTAGAGVAHSVGAMGASLDATAGMLTGLGFLRKLSVHHWRYHHELV